VRSNSSCLRRGGSAVVPAPSVSTWMSECTVMISYRPFSDSSISTLMGRSSHDQSLTRSPS